MTLMEPTTSDVVPTSVVAKMIRVYTFFHRRQPNKKRRRMPRPVVGGRR
jgi:hypothetical protein